MYVSAKAWAVYFLILACGCDKYQIITVSMVETLLVTNSTLFPSSPSFLLTQSQFY